MGRIGRAAYARCWRQLNEAYVRNYNDRRREVVSTVECLGCGSPFERPSAARHVYCSHECVKAVRRERERSSGTARREQSRAVDEFGEVASLPIRAEWDAAAHTRAEAVEAHLANAIAQADRELERRRRELPEPEPAPPPMDPATRRFFGDD